DATAAGPGEADQLEQLAALAFPSVRTGEPLVQLEQLVGARPTGEAEELREVAERRARLARACARTAHLRTSRARPHEPARDLHERRLAGAVRPEQPDELAALDGEVDSGQRSDVAVPLDESADGERCGHAPSVHSASCRAVTKKVPSQRLRRRVSTRSSEARHSSPSGTRPTAARSTRRPT